MKEILCQMDQICPRFFAFVFHFNWDKKYFNIIQMNFNECKKQYIDLGLDFFIACPPDQCLKNNFIF